MKTAIKRDRVYVTHGYDSLLSKHTFKKGFATIILSDSLKLLFSGFACPTRVKKAGQRMQTSTLSRRLTVGVENC